MIESLARSSSRTLLPVLCTISVLVSTAVVAICVPMLAPAPAEVEDIEVRDDCLIGPMMKALRESR